MSLNNENISLLLADVDGTLVDSQKRITDRAAAAIQKLESAGVKFAITSGRPPRGMKMIAEKVALSAPIAAFNGGMMIDPKTFAVLSAHTLDAGVAKAVIDAVAGFGLDVWVYAGVDWYLRDGNAPHREKEERTVQFPPTVVDRFDAAFAQGIAKVVGVSDDYSLVVKAEQAVQQAFGQDVHTKQTTASRDVHPSVSAARSQPYYLDVTHPEANKGSVVTALSQLLNIPAGEICTIGDMPNDVLMFRRSGYSIAMGQAGDEVKQAATWVTAGMDDEGFAKAVEEHLLGERPRSDGLPN